MKVGVLALQGDHAAHAGALKRAAEVLGVEMDVALVRRPEHLDGLSGLVLPGGESTTLLKLLALNGLDAAIVRFAREGGAIFGTCAGAILLSRAVRGPEQESLGLLDAVIERNAYGRQVDSFVADVELESGGEPQLNTDPVRAVFIRAPRFLDLGPGIEILARHDGDPVLVRSGRLLAATFHPELAEDSRLHALFLNACCCAGGTGRPEDAEPTCAGACTSAAEDALRVANAGRPSRPVERDELDAIVFDFHGTLVHGGDFTFDIATRVLLDSLAQSGVDVDADTFRRTYRNEVRRYFRERASRGVEQHNTVWLARTLSALGHAAEPDDEAVQRAVEAYFTRYAGEMSPLPQAVEVLATLGERYRLGLLSNFTDARPVRDVLAREGLEPHLEAIVISAEIGVRKPRPEPFARVVEALGTRPERTLYVGDDPVDDIIGAASAGLRTAWIRWAERPPLLRWVGGAPVTEAATADHALDTLAELLPLYGRR